MNRTVIVSGYLVRYIAGGHVFTILSYLAGLKQLGYDVVFVEHFGWNGSCYDPIAKAPTDDPSYNLSVTTDQLRRVGVQRWCYIAADGTYHGLSRRELVDACRSAEFWLSLWLVTWTEELLECRTKIFIDLDPGFTQFAMPTKPEPSRPGYASPYDFDLHFSYGTRIGAPDCPIPTNGLLWQPILPPVAMQLIPPTEHAASNRFTTILGWNSRLPIVYDGEVYGQKDVEFFRIIDLPKRVPDVAFEIALGGPTAPRDEIAASGWKLVQPQTVAATPEQYLEYIAGSSGEFSVATNLYVKSRSGWFSDRTAAYLASGRPAVVQDTGFSENLPCGEGLFAFTGLDDAAEAIESIRSDYSRHARAARRIAEEYFDARKVLAGMLMSSGLEIPIGQASVTSEYGIPISRS